MTLFLLSVMSFSALGIGTTPSGAHLASAYVVLFLAAVAGVVATSMSTSIMAERSGSRRATEKSVGGAQPEGVRGLLTPVLAGQGQSAMRSSET